MRRPKSLRDLDVRGSFHRSDLGQKGYRNLRRCVAAQSVSLFDTGCGLWGVEGEVFDKTRGGTVNRIEVFEPWEPRTVNREPCVEPLRAVCLARVVRCSKKSENPGSVNTQRDVSRNNVWVVLVATEYKVVV